MIYLVTAGAVALLHLAFVLFVVAGGLLAFRRLRVAWVHVPAVVWGVSLEFVGWQCPLTPLENWLRMKGGGGGYAGGFIDHYILPLLYIPGSSRAVQLALGIFALVLNLAIYAFLIRRRLSRPDRPASPYRRRS